VLVGSGGGGSGTVLVGWGTVLVGSGGGVTLVLVGSAVLVLVGTGGMLPVLVAVGVGTPPLAPHAHGA
jgi:hypothetical protein